MTFADGELPDDAFLCGRLHLWQPLKGYRAATDPVLLAAACPASPGQSVLDLGCGAGAAALCLGHPRAGPDAARAGTAAGYADLARRNAADNGIAIAGRRRRSGRHARRAAPRFRPCHRQPALLSAAQARPSPIAGPRHRPAGETPLADWVEAASPAPAPRRLADPDLLAPTACPRCWPPCPQPWLCLRPAPCPARRPPGARASCAARKGGRAPFAFSPPWCIHQGPAHDGDRESYTPRARPSCATVPTFRPSSADLPKILGSPM